MAHFAKISEENIVLQVLTLDNKDMLNESNVETESIGQAYLQQHNNWPSHLWIQTSYNTRGNKHYQSDNHDDGGLIESEDQSKKLRGNYAGIGFTWDSENEIFWSPKPYDSWVKHIDTATWKSPIGDAPDFTSEQQSQNDAGTHEWIYCWNEDNLVWDLTDFIV